MVSVDRFGKPYSAQNRHLIETNLWQSYLAFDTVILLIWVTSSRELIKQTEQLEINIQRIICEKSCKLFNTQVYLNTKCNIRGKSFTPLKNTLFVHFYSHYNNFVNSLYICAPFEDVKFLLIK